MLNEITELTTSLRGQVNDLVDQGGVAGYLAGVYHAGEQAVLACGYANVDTRTAMTEDTGFLLGSITKVMTTTLLLRYVERGAVDLDEKVTTYLPEFTLARRGHVDALRVRHLVNHTNGIDADALMPSAVKGRDAIKSYVDALAHRGALFDVDEYVSYSNPGFSVAGRILEVSTGTPFNELLERELFAPVGMTDSVTSAEQAILRRTAVGHVVDSNTGKLRPTSVFALPASGAAAGASPIVTIADLLAFARTHLADGVSPTGTRVLATELSELMRTVTHDMRTPNVPPIGLGWWLIPFGSTIGLWHQGGSPGGTSTLIVSPEHDLAFAAFGNGPSAAVFHDRLMLWLREYLGLDVLDSLVRPAHDARDVSAYEGTYHAFQFRHDLSAVDRDLEHVSTFHPIDDDHARTLTGYSGGTLDQRTRLTPVGEGLLAPAGQPVEAFTGVSGRIGLMSFHGTTGEGKPAYFSQRLRLARREP